MAQQTPNEELAKSAGDDKVVVDVVDSKIGKYEDVALSATEKAGSLKQAPSTVSPFANTRS